MKYVKLIAKPDTWFKEGTEVLYEDKDYKNRRLTLKEWETIKGETYNYGVFRGLRIVQNPASEGRCFQVGEEHDGDGECCSFDEFDVEIVNEDLRKWND